MQQDQRRLSASLDHLVGAGEQRGRNSLVVINLPMIVFAT
jgi:hypothetical protein